MQQNSIYGTYYDTNNYLFPQNTVELVQHYTRSKQTYSTINIMLMIFNKNAAFQNELEKKHINLVLQAVQLQYHQVLDLLFILININIFQLHYQDQLIVHNYDGGIFYLEMFLHKRYPMKPPRYRFLTPILPPNIRFNY